MQFPEDWPDDCPPGDSEPADGVVFRLVKNDPPTAADFRTHHETGRLPGAPACLRCGLSVFRVPEDASHMRRLFPRLGRLIAKGMLQAEHGVTKLTTGRQPTHTTWWPAEGIDRAAPFAVLEEDT
jgi:hypothetical protein